MPALTYVYAVSRDDIDLTSLGAAVADSAGSAVRTVRHDNLSAIVRSVPAVDFDEAGLKAQLENVSRLEVLARCHHAVVESLAAQATVLPLRLGTVYHDDERVAEVLDEARTEFLGRLMQLEGHAEWGVKLFTHPLGDDSQLKADRAAARTSTCPSPGRAYLLQRRTQCDHQMAAHHAAARATAHVRRAAAASASEHVSLRLHQGHLPGLGQNIANDAWLVPSTLAERFRGAVQEAVTGFDGATVKVTGPWAPYSFAANPHAADTSGGPCGP